MIKENNVNALIIYYSAKGILKMKSEDKDSRTFSIKQDDMKMIGIYRTISLCLTCFYYLFQQPNSPIHFKLGVVVCLTIASIIMFYLYKKNITNYSSMKVLVFIETIGISILLIPTGGLDSIFIWYAINPVLVAAAFLSSGFCWLNLSLYMLSMLFTNYLLELENFRLNFFISNNMNIVLILILLTIAVQLVYKGKRRLSNYNEEILRMNDALNKANKTIEEHLKQIISLYHIVDKFTEINDKEMLIQIVIKYTMNLTKSSSSFLWLVNSENDESRIFWDEEHTEIEKSDLYNHYFKEHWMEFRRFEGPTKIEIDGKDELITNVCYDARYYGLLGITQNCEDYEDDSYYALNFLSNLTASKLERLYLNEINETFLIAEEQNRIASEMHDSVAQKLFNVSCAIHTMKNNWMKMSTNDIQDQLASINKSIQNTTKELRTIIYGLSQWKKDTKTFIAEVKKYLEEITLFNHVNTKIHITGEKVTIPTAVETALFRIISEGCGNAIRHGKSLNIDIVLQLTKEFSRLKISDNGIGFDVETISEDNHTGIGLINIQELVKCFNGECSIHSLREEGTTLEIILSNVMVVKDLGGYEFESSYCR